MAKATIQLPTAFLDALNTADSQIGAFAQDALKAGAAVVEPRLRANLAGAIGRGTTLPSRSTGQLMSALGTTPVKTDSRGGHDIKVGFAENRTDGRSNALVANVLEYGQSNQPARPFLAPTRSQARRGAVEAMKQTMTAKIEGIKP
ncbi:hypothetical protein [Actinomyces minihominis]|uniref:hypothetical protein n=1 Tax=Actinomyces minihominis TaxID=2002838 RepID=UPI000C06BDEF|nr:hypothetical protein [Actinomyces minihominis]